MIEIENYEIRYCRDDEADKLQAFLDTHWKKDHILATNLELLDFQHKDKKHPRYNFSVAYNKDTDEFDVVLGFIPWAQYDEGMPDNDIWLAIWKKAEKRMPRGIGKMCLDFLIDDFKPTSIVGPGNNEGIEAFYLSMGWKAGILNLWYFLNPGNLIRFKETNPQPADYYFNPGHKTEAYYQNRFDKHPFYTYSHFQGVIYRKIVTEFGTCLRIVDLKKQYYMDEFGLHQLLKKEGADYIDCLNYGIPDEQWEKMGFRRKQPNMIIPQWFEPLDYTYHDVRFVHLREKETIIFKGDSDQDRPNLIP